MMKQKNAMGLYSLTGDIQMSTKTFSEMNKKELQEAANFYGVTDKVEELSKSKALDEGKVVPKVPTNDIYIEVLEQVKAERNGDANSSEEKVGNSHSSAGLPLSEVQYKYLHDKVPVLITDHDTSVTTEEEVEGRVINISWGNKRGRETARIPLNSGMQYVKEGALQAMEDIMIPVYLKDKTVRNKKRFGIERTTGWTKEKLEQKIQEQKAKVS